MATNLKLKSVFPSLLASSTQSQATQHQYHRRHDNKVKKDDDETSALAHAEVGVCACIIKSETQFVHRS